MLVSGHVTNTTFWQIMMSPTSEIGQHQYVTNIVSTKLPCHQHHSHRWSYFATISLILCFGSIFIWIFPPSGLCSTLKLYFSTPYCCFTFFRWNDRGVLVSVSRSRFTDREKWQLNRIACPSISSMKSQLDQVYVSNITTWKKVYEKLTESWTKKPTWFTTEVIWKTEP